MAADRSCTRRPAILGGEPRCAFSWPGWPVCGVAEESLLLEVLRSGKWWYGEKVRQFEDQFAAMQGAAHAVSCTNGTTAIEMGLRALGVVEGDEVIVPSYTFFATAGAVMTLGAIPVFADIQPDTLCIDPDDTAAKITRRTRAIVPVHVAGRIADMDRILDIAQRHEIAVLEDAAHAWGSQWEGQGAGTLGQCGTFSFQISKNIAAGEGGVLVTHDLELAELCRSYSNCGRTKGSKWYDHNVLGSNLRLTEFQAAILIAQLDRLDEQMARRTASARLLDEALSDIPGIRQLAPAPRMTRRSHHMYAFRVDEQAMGMSRDCFLEALRAEGVPASEGWYRPLYANGVFQSAHLGTKHGIRAPLADAGVDYTTVSCPVCAQVCRDIVWIPQHVLLADMHQIERLAAAIVEVVACADDIRTSAARDS